MSAIVLPVKNLVDAKRRQGPALSREERSRLAWAMLEDVTQALRESKTAERILVVTADPQVAEHARRQSWEVMEEERQVSESRSVDAACRLLLEKGVSAVLRLPADIPLLKARDVDSLLERGMGNPGALIVPSRDGSGTNALLRSPPDVFPSFFGPGSLALHRTAARQAGISLQIVENARVGFDLDTPADLSDFWQIGQGTRTWEIVNEVKYGRPGIESAGRPVNSE